MAGSHPAHVVNSGAMNQGRTEAGRSADGPWAIPEAVLFTHRHGWCAKLPLEAACVVMAADSLHGSKGYRQKSVLDAPA
jgi:hypothetical protein